MAVLFRRCERVGLTFEDGPQPGRTTAIIAALEAHCTKATFFRIGKVAGGYPEILRDVANSTVPQHRRW